MEFAAQPVRPELNVAAMSVDTEGSDVFVADEIMPVYEADAREMQWERYGVEVDTSVPSGTGERAPGDDFDEVGYGKIKDFFACSEYGYRGKVDKADEMTADRFLRAEQKLAKRLRRSVRARRELRVVAATVNSSVYASSGSYGTDVGDDWDGSGTPIEDILDACRTIEKMTGRWPNKMTLTRRQRVAISLNSQTAGQLSDARDNSGLLELERIGALVGIDKIVEPRAPYNGAGDGATPSLSNIWPDDKVLLEYVIESDDIESAQFARTFSWDGKLGGGMGQTVSYGFHPRLQEYAHFMTLHEKVLVTECAHVLHGVLTLS